MGYTKSALTGFSWMSALRMTNRALAFVKIAILARVLTPSQFGVFGIATLLLAFLEISTETGINIILIQTKEKIEEYLDSAWLVSIIRGFLIFLIILIFAPFVAAFFKTPAALNIILLISLSPLIKGFINPSEINFLKNLKYNYEFWFRTVLFLTDGLVSIALALITHSVYSLAYGLLAGSILEVIISLLFIKPTPKFGFKWNYIKDIFHKGKWVTYSGIFEYLYQNTDNIIVGRMLGSSSLGIYSMIYKISILPISEITEVVARVSFPLYVKIAHDKARLKKAFFKITLGISLATLPVGLIIFLFPKEIINLTLGPKWLGGAALLQVLAIFGVIRAISNSTSSMFMALTKQKYAAILSLVSFLILFATLIPFISIFGMLGAAYSVLISSFVVVILTAVLLYKAFKSHKTVNEEYKI